MKRTTQTTSRAAAVGVASAVALAFMAPSAAFADPAEEPDPNPQILAASNSAFVVPDGVCAVNVIVAGAPGGTAVSGGDNDDDPDVDDGVRGPNGAGGVVGSTLDVKAGDLLDIVVGGSGGDGGVGGAPGGGSGGAATHPGGGGGGYSSISVDGDLLLLAGGGGGTGGGHTPDFGAGGDGGFDLDAGIPVAGGTVFPGGDGQPGQDQGYEDPDNVTRPGGGQGGSHVGGAGGTNPRSVTDPELPGFNWNGFDGDVFQGGQGGPDNSADTGGGGGSGYFGGGGGASTDGQVGPAGNYFIGGGGGGGSSFAADSDLIDSATLWLGKNRINDPGADNDGDALAAYVSLEYIMCDYELAVAKSVLGVVDQAGAEGEFVRTHPVFEAGDIVRYAVTVTNIAGDDMGVGNTVTLIDDLAAGGTIVSVDGLNTVAPDLEGVIPANGDGHGVIALYDVVDLNNDPENERLANRGLNLGDSVTVVYDVEVQGDSSVTNTVSVADPNGVQVAEAAVDPAAPALSLVKSADTEAVTTVGQEITYSFLVTNTGNIELSGIEIVEGDFSGNGTLPDPVCEATELAPGDSTTCISVYTAVEADLTGDDLENTAVALGETRGGAPAVSDESEVKIPTVKPVELENTGGDSMLGAGMAAALLIMLGGAALAAGRLRKLS